MTKPSSDWKVANFMTLQPCTVDHGLSLEDAEDRMRANNIRHLLVTEESRLVGVLSTRDVSLGRTIKGKKNAEPSLADVMSRHVYTCAADTPLEDVAGEMEKHRYGCAVVLDDDFVVGIFTTTDAMRALRAVIAGEHVTRKTYPTHLLDVSAEREKVERHVRLSDRIVNYGNDGTIGSVL